MSKEMLIALAIYGAAVAGVLACDSRPLSAAGPHQMQCEQTAAGLASVRRCENQEVLCYLGLNSIACFKK